MRKNIYFRGLCVLLIAPIAIIWDLLFTSVKILYTSMCYFDKKGEKFIESVLDRE